ncbi:TPA: hypothetical protein ACGSS8_003092 [Pseudomonas aeruginosa]|nr:hypothetical protein [Pseudomonas aeruginosa]
MSKVKRLNFTVDQFESVVPYASEHGQYVRYADYAKLEAEAQALRKDKDRLDRLDQLNAALNAKYGTTYQWQIIVNNNINRLMLGHLQIDLNDLDCNGLPSCRDALDTIMPGISPELGDSNA